MQEIDEKGRKLKRERISLAQKMSKLLSRAAAFEYEVERIARKKRKHAADQTNADQKPKQKPNQMLTKGQNKGQKPKKNE